MGWARASARACELKHAVLPPTPIHAEESNNPNLRLWMLRKELHERDTNVDGKLDEKEFTEGAYKQLWGVGVRARVHHGV